MRAKAKWHLEGERNTQYFCPLENRHYVEKTIPKLIKEDGTEIENLMEIIEEQKKFYDILYTTRKPNISNECENTFFPQNNDDKKLN
jgi:hypothetical protein